MTTSAARQAPDQIVVANAHVNVVLAAIQNLGIPVTVADTDADLGLTLVDLDTDAIDNAARNLPSTDVAAGPDGARLDLVVVLKELYRGFHERYAGWHPTMGTNRILVGTAHNINGGGEGDPRLSSPAEMHQAQADLGAYVRVGVADTSVYVNAQLGGSCLATQSERWTADAPTAPIASGHGTFVAGLILQYAPSAELVAEQVLGRSGNADSWTVAKRLVRLARSGIHVVNTSFQCNPVDGQEPLVLATAIQRLGPNVQIVAAAGNHDPKNAADDPNAVYWPAASPDVLAVTAHDAHNTVPNWGAPAELPWVDCVANGDHVASTYPPLRLDETEQGSAPIDPAEKEVVASWSGTSFAAAAVSGLIAAEMSSTRADARSATEELLKRAEAAGQLISGKPRLG